MTIGFLGEKFNGAGYDLEIEMINMSIWSMISVIFDPLTLFGESGLPASLRLKARLFHQRVNL